MKLHWSPRSPFVRKVMIVLHETGLLDQVECIRSVVAFAAPPNPDVLPDNPLGQIPTLVLDDGRALFDSRVICEYLDGLLQSRAKLFPEGPERIVQMRWQSLGDGLTALLLCLRTERLRSAPEPAIEAALMAKAVATMAVLEKEAPILTAIPFGIGQIAIICALGQMDFRFAAASWRNHFPALALWEGETRARASITATAVIDDGETVSARPSLEVLEF